MSAHSGEATFLFTDIEGSTRRWEADPEVMRAAMEAHDELLLATVDAHEGRVFKHTGDGMCAVFLSPQCAVDAAVAAQYSLQLPVRMGVVTGEAEMRAGDYFGAVLNRAARLMSAGHGGQILLDGTTADLITGFDLLELGPRRLRDITKPVEIFQVSAPGLRPTFPPLKVVDPAQGNLRSSTTSLIGREVELTGIESALQKHRLVTLTGVGGVGKTRLALEVAAQLADSFYDGVWVIELAAVGQSAAVPDAVAAALSVTQQPGLSLADSVTQALDGRRRLLVFDNCEHVIDAAADLVEAILTRSAAVKILATSREGLRVGDEQLMPLHPLNTGADSSAVALFVERAQAVAPGFAVAEAGETAAVVDICSRLDGIPLAIELAASRLLSMTVTELRDRLDHRLRFLVGARRGLERHQTLRHAVQWSYDLLDDTEKAVLTKCSVFAGGFELEGAHAVAGKGFRDEFGTLEVLEALVRKSLLIATSSSARTRFSMLETIRQFADEQLVAAGDAHDVRTAHARYFAGLESTVLAVWDSPQQREAYAWFTVELPNLRTAFRWAADHGDLDTASAIAIYATSLGFRVEQYEPIGWAEELVFQARSVEHRRLAQLFAVAAQCHVTGRLDDFLRYSAAGEIAIGDPRFDPVGDELDSIGTGFLTIGQPERAIPWCRRMIARETGNHDYSRACLILGLAMSGAGDDALAASQALLETVETMENPNLASFALLACGWACRATDPLAAYEIHRRGLTIAQASGNRQLESLLSTQLSSVAATYADPIDAIEYLSGAIRNLYDSGSFSLLDMPLAVLVALLDRLGRYEAAATLAQCSATPLTLTALIGIPDTIEHIRAVLGGDVYESCARVGQAMSNAGKAMYAFEQIDLARRSAQRLAE